jgi:hypothetical protein
MKQRFAALVEDLTAEIPEDPLPELNAKLQKAFAAWKKSKGNQNTKSYKQACQEVAPLFVYRFGIGRHFDDSIFRVSRVATISSSLDRDEMFDVTESDDHDSDIENIFKADDDLIFPNVVVESLSFEDGLSPTVTLSREFELDLTKKFNGEEAFQLWQSENMDFDDIGEFIPNETIFAGYDEDGDIDTSYSYESGDESCLIQRPKESLAEFRARLKATISAETSDDDEEEATEWSLFETAIRTGDIKEVQSLLANNQTSTDSETMSPLSLAISGAVYAERLYPSLVTEAPITEDLHPSWTGYQKALRKIVTILLEDKFGPETLMPAMLLMLKSSEEKVADSILRELKKHSEGESAGTGGKKKAKKKTAKKKAAKSKAAKPGQAVDDVSESGIVKFQYTDCIKRETTVRRRLNLHLKVAFQPYLEKGQSADFTGTIDTMLAHALELDDGDSISFPITHNDECLITFEFDR